MSRWRWAGVVLAILAVGLGLVAHRGAVGGAKYATSESCRQCHVAHYESWHRTLHPKMFRPVREPGDVLGDFDAPNPIRNFKREDIQFVLGNRWEQVYARLIDGEYYPFTAKWHVIQKRWVPFRVDDWKSVKMSYKCNGCHTTGFDAATLKFSEFGIGCEACHGPGRNHVDNRKRQAAGQCSWCHDRLPATEKDSKDIIRSVSAAVCAQCHDRGSNKVSQGAEAGKFAFPVGNVPDGDPAQAFKSLGPADDKKGEFWWGVGVSRNRHQEFADWNLSGHAKALQNVHETGPTACPRTGAAKAECLHCHSTDHRLAPPDAKPDLDHARFGVTCVACHEPHGTGGTMTRGGDGNAACGGCHIQNLARRAAQQGKPHIPCPSNQVQCADCHMPRVVETGGFFSLRSHAFRIITPMEARGENMPNSCQNGGCHAERDSPWLIAAYQRHYPAKSR